MFPGLIENGDYGLYRTHHILGSLCYCIFKPASNRCHINKTPLITWTLVKVPKLSSHIYCENYQSIIKSIQLYQPDTQS